MLAVWYISIFLKFVFIRAKEKKAYLNSIINFHFGITFFCTFMGINIEPFIE